MFNKMKEGIALVNCYIDGGCTTDRESLETLLHSELRQALGDTLPLTLPDGLREDYYWCMEQIKKIGERLDG